MLASTIFTNASVILQDANHVRWPLQELQRWLNDSLRAIVIAKPSANSTTLPLSLVAGTLQSLTDDNQLQFMGLVRNLKDVGPPRIGGRAIRATTRPVMDASEPNWHDPDEVEYTAEVRQFMFDEENPRQLYVYPGNDGTGLVEALVSSLPDVVVATGPVDEIGSFAVPVSLGEPWGPIMLDYVLYRAFAKDSEGGAAGRAQMHYQAFAQAVGIKVQMDRAIDPAARARVPSQ